MALASPQLLWECTKKNSSFIRKSANMPVMSSDPNNLCGLNSYKFSGVCGGAVLGLNSKKAGSKVMTKGGLAEALASEHGLKRSQCTQVIDSLAAIATKEVKSSGKFVLPGLCMIKTRLKPATKAGKREMFGKTVVVKAKPAKTVVKAFPVAALKKSI